MEEPILIDEEKLLRALGASVDELGFNFQSLFSPFNNALRKYVSLDEKAFFELLNSLPENLKKTSDEFFDLKLEELLKLPVMVSRAEVNQVTQKQNNSRVEALKRAVDQNAISDVDNSFSDYLPTMRIFTISIIPPTPYPTPSVLPPPSVNTDHGLPTTPTITVDSQFTGGLNKEILLNTQALVALTGNVFHEGATGGVRLSAYFASPVRPGSTENRTFSDKVILISPDGNTLTLYTASTEDHWIGDFIYELNHALPHKLNTPGLDVINESGHKVFTDHFLYSLQNEYNGTNVGIIDVEIIDDVPVATNQIAVTISEADIFNAGSNLSNTMLMLTGDLLSDPTKAINRIGPDGGTVFDVYLQNNTGNVIATTTTLFVSTDQGNELIINRLTGAYTYTLNNPFDNANDPNATNTQAQEIFVYEILDNDGDSAMATLTITVLDDKPNATEKLNEANETAYFVNLSAIVTGNLITDDNGFGPALLGADGATITSVNNTSAVNGIITAATTYGSIDVYTVAQGQYQIGDYAYSLDGAKTILANDALMQVIDTISYVLTDNDSPSTSSSQLNITVNLNQAPTANDDTGSTDEETVLNVNAINGVLANDTDPNVGDTKIISAVNGVENDVGAAIVLPSGATLQLNANGSYSYDPRGVFDFLALNASATDDITYTMQDAEGLTSNATLTITITGLNDAPTANDDSNTTHGSTVIEVNSALDPNALLANDTDPDTGDELLITAVNGVPGNVGNQFALASGALLTVNADGTYQYDPNGKFATTGSDNFAYSISDGQGGTSSANVAISIIVPPIVLDLNDDGISLISVENSSVAWKFPCGNYHLTGWVGPDDGLLVYDANKDGRITSLEEFSFASYHPEAKQDLEGLLLAFDTNHDGIFDINDALFSDFAVWQDKNSDGITDDGELRSLIDWGITSISLDSDHQIQLVDGNIIFGSIDYQTQDGKIHLAADVGLAIGNVSSPIVEPILVNHFLGLEETGAL